MPANLGPRRDPGPVPPLQRRPLDGQESEQDAPADQRQEPAERARPIEVVHRAAPRYGRFIWTGLLLGAVLAFILAFVSRGWSGLTTTNTFWLLTIGLGALGMLIGAAVALRMDRKSLRTMRDQMPKDAE